MKNNFISKKDFETTLTTLFRMARIAELSLAIDSVKRDEEQGDEEQRELNEQMKKDLIQGATSCFGMYSGLSPQELTEDQRDFLIKTIETIQKKSYEWVKEKMK